jgi:hypothetical protein
MWSKLKRTSISIGLGLLFSVAYNIGALYLARTFDPYGEGWISHLLFAPGFLIAGRGFEAQSIVLPVNAVVFFVVFGVLTWMFQRQITS